MTIPDPLPEAQLSSMAYTAQHWCESWRTKHSEDQADTFDLNAPYQRGSVWTVEQRRNLIKSLLMGLPTGNIVVARLNFKDVTESPYRVVDGKQRIEAIRAFADDEFTVPTWWFDPRDLEDPATREIEGAHVLFSELSQRGHRVLFNSHMSALEFNPCTLVTENMDFDETLVDKHRGKPLPGYEGDPRTVRWNRYERTDEEILQAEAELYLLVNFGGVAQTDDDKTRAASVAGGSS